MPLLEIEFETWIDSKGYECFARKSAFSSIWFQPKGGTLVKRRPLDFHATLYKQFADLPDDPDAYLDFMNKFGPITYLQDPGRVNVDYGEWLENAAVTKDELQELIEDWNLVPSAPELLVPRYDGASVIA